MTFIKNLFNHSRFRRRNTMHSGQVTYIWCLLFMVGMGFVSFPSSAAKHRFTVEDDIGVAHFGDIYTGMAEPITFSPDGLYFVVDTERGVLDQNRPESTLRVYRTEDVSQFLSHPEMIGEPSPAWMFSKSTFKDGPIITHIRWLSDSSGFAFLAKTVSGNNELFLADLRTKSVDALTPGNQHLTSFDIRDRGHVVYSALSPAISQRASAEGQATSIVGTGR